MNFFIFSSDPNIQSYINMAVIVDSMRRRVIKQNKEFVAAVVIVAAIKVKTPGFN